MKKTHYPAKLLALFVFFGMLATEVLHSQVPLKMSYQAVVRDGDNELVINTGIGMQLSIIQGTPEGSAVFVERHFPTTNDNGLVSLHIGEGTLVSGSMDAVDWADGPYFIKTETDLRGGANYTLLHTIQLLSVPYAMHARTADSLSYAIEESDPVFTAAFDFEGVQHGDLLVYDSQLGQWVRFTPEYLTSFEEQDPVFAASVAAGIHSEDVDNWHAAHAWGDHAQVGYLAEEVQTLADVLGKGNAAGGLQIKNMADPTDPQDAVTLSFFEQTIDSLILQIDSLRQALTFQCGDFVTFIYFGQSVIYGTVEGQNGRCWLDRNLGALRVATSPTDEQAYGDLFQWGRAADGHQIRTSGTTSTASSADTPGHGNFIIGSIDWRNPRNDDLWQGVNGVNSPCPPGFRLPTEAELDAERQSWSSIDSDGAFASPLKLPAAGYRDFNNGSLIGVGSGGIYWSSNLEGNLSRALFLISGNAAMSSYFRARGISVRCLKND